MKPRKRRVGWKRFVVVPSRVTEPRRSLRASAVEAAPRAARSPPSMTETVAGRRSRGIREPGRGVTPTTSTRSAMAPMVSVTSTTSGLSAVRRTSRRCGSNPPSEKVRV